MTTQDYLLLFGASTRAAAFSALRANLRPWCADLFADCDLAARCPVIRVPIGEYPRAFAELARRNVPGPWMYTGGLENRRKLVRTISSIRPLWGNEGRSLRLCRSPKFLTAVLARENLPHPRLQKRFQEPISGARWLLKPIHGSSGAGIVFLSSQAAVADRRRKTYCQEYIEGEPCSAVYVGDGHDAWLGGATRQLVGETWLHVGPFRYCGSIGPYPLGDGLRQGLQRIGRVLARACGLRGLFGVDFIVRNDVPYPVEVNPRYTASVEVLEYATGWQALAEHRKIFDAGAVDSLPGVAAHTGACVGKAILFAGESLVFPEEGPWHLALRNHASVHELPPFADIPRAEERIERGRPILTLFARGTSAGACLDALRTIARDLDRWLFHR